MGTCSVDGCETTKIMGLGLCPKHYMRQRRHGSATREPYSGTPIRVWLDAHLAASVETDECIDWPFGTRLGYGRVKDSGRTRMVTHVVLERFVGPHPAGARDALHSCDRPLCVNPRHLRWGDAKENSADMHDRGRANHPRGEAHGRTSLTAEDVAAIRASLLPQRETAALYGITQAAVSKIVRRETWTHC